MKRKLICLFILLFTFNIRVNALKCITETIDLSKVYSFQCDSIKGSTLKFNYDNGTDVSNYFKLREDNKNIDIVDNKIVDIFNKNSKEAIIEVSDSASKTVIKIKNPNYQETTKTIVEEQTSTTTTVNSKVLYGYFKDGEDVVEKKCEIVNNSNTCSITMPTSDKEGFSGWGTAEECKEGNRGTVKLEKDTTYYACYKTKENDNKLLLDTLILRDKATGDIIKFDKFDSKVLKYSFKVLYDVENIDVEASAIEGTNINVFGNENLNVGDNTITVILKNADNLETTYEFNVKRLKKGETLSGKHYLKSLVIGGYNINFKKDIFNYNLKINNEDNLLITETPEEKDVKTKIIGNENLKDGSIIKINVIGKDSTTTYTINIIKEYKINYTLLAIVLVISIAILVLVIIIFIKTKKNNNKTSNIKKTKKKNDNTINNENVEVLKF